MSQRIVFTMPMSSQKNRRRVLRILAKIEDINCIQINSKDNTITAIGDVDPMCLVSMFRKYRSSELVSFASWKDPRAQFNFTPAFHHTSSETASTSTSAWPSSSSYVYDVFINHRGPDTKTGLASHLYHALVKHGYEVFLDNEEMRRGESLSPQLEGAIQTASVHLAIFSPRYAESEWCLKELVLMLESRSTVIPVFYDVQPSDLRRTLAENGVYALALSTLGQRKTIDSNTIKEWTNALSVVSKISGFELETCNRDQGQLAEKVVQKVLEKVRKTPLNVAKYPTGLHDKVKDFERTVLLQQHSQETRVIGIVGLGGVGKTTLAKKIFNSHSKNYKKSCFLLDVREKSLISMQSKLVKDFAQLNKQIDHVDSGVEEIKKHLRFSSEPVLMLLDDVDHVDQLDSLLVPVKETLHAGSLILVTSRNKNVLRSSGIVESCIYKLTGLNQQNSRELFCLHAFGQGKPEIGFEQVVENFLSACDGLPLSLKVLGASLRGQSLEDWKAQFREISNILPDDIRSKLEISYDALNVVGKQMFLDIACFFVGEERDTIIRIWDASHWEGRLGLQNLENRCLLEVDSKNRIRMHDHLRDLGRYLADKEPPEGLRRLWHPSNNFLHLSKQSTVRGISMVNESFGGIYYRGIQLRGTGMSSQTSMGSRFVTDLSRLQLLRAEGYCVKSIFTVGQSTRLRCLSWYDCLYSFLPSWISVQSLFRVEQSPHLRWLCWYDCPYSFLPPWIPVQNLRVLQIEGSKLKTLWQHGSPAPLHLRELNIKACFFKIPKSIGKLEHLQKFVLRYTKYRDAVDLETLPDEFCYLHSLEHVELKKSKIKSLPHSFGELSNLRCIRLLGCSNLEMLPDSFGNLANLQDIHLSLSRLKMLPESFGNLTNLQDIHLSLSRLKMLPESFSNLVNLQHMDLSKCSILQKLPNSFENFRNLQDIDLSGCSNLKTLPDSIGHLKKLRHISLSDCSQLIRLPHSFENLKNLQDINLSGCSELKALPHSFGNLNNLQRIYLSWCYKLETLPESFANLKNLQHINLGSCLNLHTLPDIFGDLTSLRHLDLSHCRLLEKRPISLQNLIQAQSQL